MHLLVGNSSASFYGSSGGSSDEALELDYRLTSSPSWPGMPMEQENAFGNESLELEGGGLDRLRLLRVERRMRELTRICLLLGRGVLSAWMITRVVITISRTIV